MARNQRAKTTHFDRRPAGKVNQEPRIGAASFQRCEDEAGSNLTEASAGLLAPVTGSWQAKFSQT